MTRPTEGCPRCGGLQALDGYERDGTFYCVNCGYVQWPAAVIAASQQDAAQLTAALARPRGRYARRAERPLP